MLCCCQPTKDKEIIPADKGVADPAQVPISQNRIAVEPGQ